MMLEKCFDMLEAAHGAVMSVTERVLVKLPKAVLYVLFVLAVVLGAAALSAGSYSPCTWLVSAGKFSVDGFPIPVSIALILVGAVLELLALHSLNSLLGKKEKKPRGAAVRLSDKVNRSMYWTEHVLYPIAKTSVPAKQRADSGVIRFADASLSCGRDVVRNAGQLRGSWLDRFEKEEELPDEWAEKTREARQDIENLVTIWESALEGSHIDVHDSPDSLNALGEKLGVGAMIDAWQGGLPFEDVTGKREAELR